MAAEYLIAYTVRMWKTQVRRAARAIAGIVIPQTAHFEGMTLPARHLRFGGRHFREDRDFAESGRREADRLARECGLTRASRVLEIGCGPGRLPIGVIDRVGDIQSYLGLDVSAAPVAWCSRYISKEHPAFRFMHIDVRNERYNKDGNLSQDELRLPVDDASVDVIYLYSVFSHLDERDIRAYLREFSRVLRPGGHVFLTAFVEENVPPFSENPEGYGPTRWRGALHCVRYESAFFTGLLHEAGFAIRRMDHGTETDGQSGFHLLRS